MVGFLFNAFSASSPWPSVHASYHKGRRHHSLASITGCFFTLGSQQGCKEGCKYWLGFMQPSLPPLRGSKRVTGKEASSNTSVQHKCQPLPHKTEVTEELEL